MSIKTSLAITLALFTASFARAATVTVTSTNDSGSGSLRDAIATAASGDTIAFSLSYPATITLASTLNIDTSLTISGPGASNLAISGNHICTIFWIAYGTNVSISGLTIENGYSGYSGGGIYNYGSLTLTDSALTRNSTASSGGAIASGGVLTLSNSTVSENSSVGGGGIDSWGTLVVANSAILLNSAGVGGIGGGLYNEGTLALITNSTISDNFADFGGGVFNKGPLKVTNSTIARNTASSNFGGGGAIANAYNAMALKNTILADSAYGGNCYLFFSSSSSDGYNLSDDNSCSSFLTAAGDLNNTPAGLDPNGLQNNGGPTQTIALLPGSPAVDAIPVSPTNYCTAIDGVTPITTDQRGVSRPQGTACDIGAFELNASGYTAVGTNVSDQPTDTTSGGTPVTLTFADVTQAGTSSLNTGSAGPPSPDGFKLGNPPVYYDLGTTAVFSGSVTVCVNYAGTTFANPSKIRLFHYVNGSWVDITTSVNIATTTVCGSTTSFSPFAIFESDYTASIQPPIKADGSSVFAANRGVVPVKFTLALGGTTTCQLPPATVQVTETAGATPGAVNQSEFSTQADSGSNFRIDTANCQYVYNLAASNLGAGTYSVQIVIEKVAVGSATFGLN